MPLKKSLLLILMVVFTIAACKKSQSLKSKSTDVYVAGYVQSERGPDNAVYWKNGVMVRLADSSVGSYATAIAINGNDIYVAGTLIPPGGVPEAGYWKNGTFKSLGPLGAGGSVNAIAVSNNNVYVAGATAGPYSQPIPTYWNNGIQHILTDSTASSTGSIYGLTLNGSDVYLSGIVTSSDRNHTYPVYWKNDVPVYLSGDGLSFAQGITVANGKIYVTGDLGKSDEIVYWQDGYAMLLGGIYPASTANVITSSGNDVYIAGSVFVRSSETLEATYWKNNNPVDIGTILNGTINAIAVSGSDVYTAGSYFPPPVFIPFDSNTYDGKAVYWKNNTPIKLSTVISEARGIALVQTATNYGIEK